MYVARFVVFIACTGYIQSMLVTVVLGRYIRRCVERGSLSQGYSNSNTSGFDKELLLSLTVA